ncbi:lytic transglycosylase domain-containing protein [Streptomyces sp. NPDC004610]|uniref:lytic transglycosylase domain-containing protein n=1 Tax=unclassified Streptomyces TaxID=2593676 RepID=UPI0033A0F470
MAAHFGSRLRKGAATTAVAAAAVAALSASQAPGVTSGDQGRQTTADSLPSADATVDDDSATGNSPYYTDLPPLTTPTPSVTAATGGTAVATGDAEAGIPATVLDAYKKAAAALGSAKPSCNLPWELLAAIGKVESGQARGGDVDADGTTINPILGPQLDGNGFALIRDTDNGEFDGNAEYDQAVGPMQFIPSTWAWAGRDGNGDGVEDPNNIYDAALAAGHYLCRFDWDLSTSADLRSAILSYNNSTEYYNTVVSWLEYYRKGTHEVPDGSGTLPVDRSDDDRPASTPPPATESPEASPRPTPPPAEPTPPGGGPSTPPTTPPTTPPGTTPPPTTTPPTATDRVHHLEDAGTPELTAMAGDAFAAKPSARAEDKDDKGVAKVRVRFSILGDTDATFSGGEKVAVAVTDASGKAVAPALQAGEQTGDFTVRATLVGRTLAGLDHTATVTARAADTLTTVGDPALTCVAGGEFADEITLKATYKGAAADGVAATATLIKSVLDPTANDKGPYFKDADNKAVRTLTGLTTDADGQLKLPKLYADDAVGTYLLRVTTTGGATRTLILTVTKPDPTPAPSDSAPASPSASPSPSA